MTRDKTVETATKLVDSVLVDLAADRISWSKPEVFESVTRELRRNSFRLAEDSSNLAAVSVGEIKNGLLQNLGTNGYARLLNSSADERADIAREMLEVESDACAAEGFSMPRSIDPQFVERLPLPFLYLIVWAEGKTWKKETETIVNGMLDDIRHARAEWVSMAKFQPDEMLLALRRIPLDLLARSESPAEVRDQLEAVLGRRVLAQLLEANDIASSQLAAHVYSHLGGGAYGYDRDDLPDPRPELPDAILAMACWATAFGPDDMGGVVRAMLSDISQRSALWQELDRVSSEPVFWLADLVVKQVGATSPLQTHARLTTELGSGCLAELFELPEKAIANLGHIVYFDARPNRSPFSSEEFDVVSTIAKWGRRWCAKDERLMSAINQQ
jgi:hypothetical protein